MKTISWFHKTVSCLIVSALLIVGAKDLYTRAQAQALPAGIVLAIVGIASCVIIKAMHHPQVLLDRVVVLQVNYRNGNGWENVVTNFHAVIYCDHPCSIFGVQMRMIQEDNEAAKFRIEDITDWWRSEHPYGWDSLQQQFVTLPETNRLRAAWSIMIGEPDIPDSIQNP